MNNTFSNHLFNRMPIVGILRNIPARYLEQIAEAYYASGLTCLEITMNSPAAEESISKLAGQYAGRLNIGAGTVCSMDDLEKALAADAQFIVTPIINEEVIKACVSRGVPIFPGAYTPSEMYRAWTLGATMVKLFPGGDLKPGYIKEVLAPLPYLPIMPTGGVTLDNFTSYLANGAKGVGIGSHLFPKDILAREDWSALAEVYNEFVKRYREFAAVK